MCWAPTSSATPARSASRRRASWCTRRSIREFVERFTAYAKNMKVGNGLEADTKMGPLVAERRLHAMDSFVSDAIAKGAKIQTGGQRKGNKGYFYEPTVHDRRAARRQDHERGAVRPAGADHAVQGFRRRGEGSQPPAVGPGGLRLHQEHQDRGGDRRRLRERHGVDQPPWPGAARKCRSAASRIRATARKAASRRSRPTSTPSSSASSACDGRSAARIGTDPSLPLGMD